MSNTQSGSTSVRKLLDPYSDIKSSTEHPYHHHVNAKKLRRHFEEKGWDWSTYFKFTTMRNPWDRMVGRYHYGLKNPKSIWHEPAASARCFAEFLDHPFIARVTPKATLFHFAYGEDGECLVDRIIKLEDIRSELPRVLEELGLPVHLVTHVNRSSHRHYSFYYDDATREQVRDWFRFEIDFGGYVFERRSKLMEDVRGMCRILYDR